VGPQTLGKSACNLPFSAGKPQGHLSAIGVAFQARPAGRLATVAGCHPVRQDYASTAVFCESVTYETEAFRRVCTRSPS
jgi:hypothetical protein